MGVPGARLEEPEARVEEPEARVGESETRVEEPKARVGAPEVQYHRVSHEVTESLIPFPVLFHIKLFNQLRRLF